MTLGVVGGAVGVAAGVAAGVAGAALQVGAEIASTILDVADPVCKNWAEFAMQEHSKRTGVAFRLVAVVKARLKEVHNGKIFILTISVDAHINGVWTRQTFEAQVSVLSLSGPSLSSCECVD